MNEIEVVMNKLSKDWFLEGLIDFEYKKYILLDYLKQVHTDFNNTALYPSLAEVIDHYRNLSNYVKNKNEIADLFPKEINKAKLSRLKIEYKSMITDDKLIDELQNISDYAINQFKSTLNAGKEIYEFAESHLTIEPIGIRPMYVNEGYMFTILPPGNKTDIYLYKVRLFESDNDSYRGLMLNYVYSKSLTIANTLENIKVDLAKQFNELPNPASYVVSSSMNFPYASTFLPIAKRLLIRNIAA